MKEIEVKARISNKPQLLEKLAALGCELSAPITQRDQIFVPHGVTVPTPPGVNVLRIRQQDGATIFTLKQAISNQLDCLERELGIDDPAAMADIFKLLGFEESSRVNKTRQKGLYNGLEICVDSVEGLGDFIEVEKLSEDADSAAVQAELFAFLKTLGVQESDRVYDGYDVLMIKSKQGLL